MYRLRTDFYLSGSPGPGTELETDDESSTTSEETIPLSMATQHANKYLHSRVCSIFVVFKLTNTLLMRSVSIVRARQNNDYHTLRHS